MHNKIPKAQLEVWDWKEKAADSLSNFSNMSEKLAAIRRRTQPLAAELNSQLPSREDYLPLKRL